MQESEETKNIKWTLRVFSTDTLALAKDTDKEDKEKALKASWETTEPGRSDKAKKSRQRFLLERRKKEGEEIAEDEQELLNEQRQRGNKGKEEVVVDPKAKGGKGAPAKKEDKKAPVEEEVKVERKLPDPTGHVNDQIKGFFDHFMSDRRIHIPCDKPQARKREDDEKETIEKKREEEKEKWTTQHSVVVERREAEKEEQD